MRTALNSNPRVIHAEAYLAAPLTGTDLLRDGATLPTQFSCQLDIDVAVITEPTLVSDVLDCSVVQAFAPNTLTLAFTHD